MIEIRKTNETQVNRVRAVTSFRLSQEETLEINFDTVDRQKIVNMLQEQFSIQELYEEWPSKQEQENLYKEIVQRHEERKLPYDV